MSKELAPAEFCQETISIKNRIEVGFLALAERLHKIKEEKLYEGGWDSFADYLAEMDMSEAGASKLTKVYREWVLNAGLSPAQLAETSTDKLYTGLKLLESGTPEEALEKVTTLRRDDIRAIVGGHDECEHTNVVEGYVRCGDCGKVYKAA